MEHGKFKELLGIIDELSAGQAQKLEQALANRGDLDRAQRLIEQAFLKDLKCPHCDGGDLYRWGWVSGFQRWRCKGCKKTFNALTGTPLARLRKKEQWLNFARTLTQSLSVRKAAKICKVAKNTSLRWRHRLLAAKTNAKDQSLKGVVEVDEIFFLESFKGKRNLPRPPRKRGGKAKKRGLSKEQIPVLIARDRHGSHVDAVLPDRSRKSVSAVLQNRIPKDALMFMDSDAATIAFAEDAGIEYETIVASKGEHVVEKVIHVQNVNGYASRLKKWMRRFNGVATEYLPLYLAWRRALDPGEDSLTPESCLVSALR
jgi:transposase-like protein